MSDILTEKENMDKLKIINTDEEDIIGANRCPTCGATDFLLNEKNGKLKCSYCRNEFEIKNNDELSEDITKLKGKIISSGANDIQDMESILMFECNSCGAEVIIDVNEVTYARCHWCRSTLSVNKQLPNGIIPDVVLPFNVTQEEAKDNIQNFVKSRQFFAHPKFKQEFTANNVMGVYLPYMIIDVNSHAVFKGQGEIETRRYTVGSGDNRRTYYDADLYDVEREFDITIDDLTVESSKDKIDRNKENKTNNIINSIMPFDTENCVEWNANYLKGYSSEKRDANIDELRPYIETQIKDIARFAANDSLKQYDRGVKWDNENLEIKGEHWKTAYLPVWLYSYMQKKNRKKVLHYVAVNGRTKETMGSIPIYMPKLIGVSTIIEILSGFGTFWLDSKLGEDCDVEMLLLSSGILFFWFIYNRYRNIKARHSHENETKKTVFNLRKLDIFRKERKRLSSAIMEGANNEEINADIFKLNIEDSDNCED